MISRFLPALSSKERTELIERLNSTQNGKCFICEERIDIELQKDSLDIDHIIPLKLGGKDDQVNFALTHSSCNRSKQDSNLEVARVIKRFEKLKDNIRINNRGVNLADILGNYNGGKYKLKLIKNKNQVSYSFSEISDNQIYEIPVFTDELTKDEYFFAQLPIEYVFHDDEINPRTIGDNISKLVKEFYNKNPQLHVSLGWITLEDGVATGIKIFDGQHKAAAQILLGVKKIPVRVFVNPNKDKIIQTNFNAGTTLRQVAFDKSVQRHLGNTLFAQRVKRYQSEHDLEDDDFSFSERDLINYFKGESREVKRYILDSNRDAITYSPDNKLRSYTEIGGRGNTNPVSYSTIEKTFYSFFIQQDVLQTPINYKLDEGENPRELEKMQIVELMNIIAEELLVGKYDFELGTYRVENKVQTGEDMPLLHLRAVRMTKEEIIYNWLRYVSQIIKTFYLMQGKPIQEDKLFQYKFPEPLWNKVRIFVKNMANLPVWINKDFSNTIFGGKQNYSFWQTIFESGKSPSGVQVLTSPIDLMEMIKE